MTKDPLITRKSYREYKKKSHQQERPLPWQTKQPSSAKEPVAPLNSLSEKLAAKKDELNLNQTSFPVPPIEKLKTDPVTEKNADTPKVTPPGRQDSATATTLAAGKKRFHWVRANDGADKNSLTENEAAAEKQSLTDNQSEAPTERLPVDKFLNIGIGLFLLGIIIVTSIAVFF